MKIKREDIIPPKDAIIYKLETEMLAYNKDIGSYKIYKNELVRIIDIESHEKLNRVEVLYYTGEKNTRKEIIKIDKKQQMNLVF
ncbi:MAG: hypothetical protein ACP5RT_02215 [Candidatus Micrarchaeia archaeon]